MPVCKGLFIRQKLLIELIGQHLIILCVIVKIYHETGYLFWMIVYISKVYSFLNK